MVSLYFIVFNLVIKIIWNYIYNICNEIFLNICLCYSLQNLQTILQTKMMLLTAQGGRFTKNTNLQNSQIFAQQYSQY